MEVNPRRKILKLRLCENNLAECLASDWLLYGNDYHEQSRFFIYLLATVHDSFHTVQDFLSTVIVLAVPAQHL